jgi:hypothetical protein
MAPPSLDLDRALRSAAQALRVPPFEVNPFASLGFLRDGTAFDFSIVAPIPGEGLRRTMVRRGHADLHTFLFRLMLPGRGETPPDVVRHELVRCGVLVPPDAVPREVPFDRPGESIVNAPAVSPATLASARGQLAGRGFAELQSLLHPAWLASLRAYYEAQFREGFFEAVDAHRRRFAAHDEKVAADLHRQLLPLIAAAMPGRLAPGHCDVSLDREGAVIEKPAGREGSEYTLFLTIDAQPSTARDAAWPLCLQLPNGGTARSLLAPGDGLLFRSRELPHFREALPAGGASWSAAFHFMPAGHPTAANRA